MGRNSGGCDYCCCSRISFRLASGTLDGIPHYCNSSYHAVLVGVAHFRWEREATRTTYEQMALLRQNGEVDVDFQYFREPFGERLRAAGVTFRAVRVLQCDNPMELMSVAPGYQEQFECVYRKSEEHQCKAGA